MTAESGASAPRRFACSPGGVIVVGRKRLRNLLVGVTIAMVVLSIAVWLNGQKTPALLVLAVAFIAWTAWRMSGDLDPLWIEIGDDSMSIQMRRRRLTVPLLAPSARRLTDDESRHLAQLASTGWIVAGTGGFDSHKLGEFNLHATDLANSVLFDSGESRLIVTPDDPDAFVSAVAAGSHGATGHSLR